jgi:hypothetical protein
MKNQAILHVRGFRFGHGVEIEKHLLAIIEAERERINRAEEILRLARERRKASGHERVDYRGSDRVRGT